MAAGRIVIPNWMPALDSDGEPIPGARMFFYQNETTTLQTIYANENLTATLPNPLSANASGRFQDVWADTSLTYSVVVDAPYGPPGAPFTYDNVVAGSNGGGGGSDAELRSEVESAVPLALSTTGLIDPTSLEDGYQRMYEDVVDRWWQTPQNRIWGQVGGYAVNNQQPFQWAMCNLHEVFYWRAKQGDADAAAKVQQNWTELLARKGSSVLSQARLVNDIGASDDLAWMLRYLTRVHDITGLTQPLTIASALLASGRSVFADPANPSQTWLLYTTDDLANGTNNTGFNPDLIRLGHYRAVATNDIWTAAAALYMDAALGSTTRRQFAINTYEWIKQYAIHPLGVVYCEVDVNPANPGVPKPVENPTGVDPIQPHFSYTAIHMTFAFMALCKRLNDVAPDPRYLQDINAMMAAVLRTDTFLRPGPMLLPDRDGWGNGLGFCEFVTDVLPMPGIDEDNANKIKQALVNTALSACRQRTDRYYYNKGRTYGEGFYGADWTGPELGSNGIMTWFQTGNNTTPDIATPEQIPTAGSTCSMITAAWLAGDIEGTSQLVAYPEFIANNQKIAETYVPMLGGVTIRDGLNFSGPIRRDNDFFLDLFTDFQATGPVALLAFDDQDYIAHFRTLNRMAFRIGGQSKLDLTEDGVEVFGGLSVSQQFFVGVASDLNFSLGANGTDRNISFDAGGDYIRYSRTQNQYDFFIGNGSFFAVNSGGATVGGGLTATGSIFASGDTNFYLGKVSGQPILAMDNQDFMRFNRTANRYEFVIGNTIVAYIDSAGFHNGAP